MLETRTASLQKCQTPAHDAQSVQVSKIVACLCSLVPSQVAKSLFWLCICLSICLCICLCLCVCLCLCLCLCTGIESSLCSFVPSRGGQVAQPLCLALYLYLYSYCVTQLKLYTLDNLSSTIFCRLSVRDRCHPTKSQLFQYIQA